MNKHLFTLLFTCALNYSFSQDSTFKEIPKTKVEQFNLKVGSVLKKEFIDLYDYNDKSFFSTGTLKVEVEIISDAASGEGIRGLRFSNEHIGFIDEQEIPNLIKFLDFLQTLDGTVPNNYTEYDYNFKDLNGFACYQTISKNLKWIYGFQTNKYYSGSSVNMKIENINDLKSKIKSYFKID